MMFFLFFFGKKKCCVKKKFGEKIFFGQKHFLVIFFVLFLWSKNVFGEKKNVYVKKIFFLIKTNGLKKFR